MSIFKRRKIMWTRSAWSPASYCVKTCTHSSVLKPQTLYMEQPESGLNRFFTHQNDFGLIGCCGRCSYVSVYRSCGVVSIKLAASINLSRKYLRNACNMTVQPLSFIALENERDSTNTITSKNSLERFVAIRMPGSTFDQGMDSVIRPPPTKQQPYEGIARGRLKKLFKVFGATLWFVSSHKLDVGQVRTVGLNQLSLVDPPCPTLTAKIIHQDNGTSNGPGKYLSGVDVSLPSVRKMSTPTFISSSLENKCTFDRFFAKRPSLHQKPGHFYVKVTNPLFSLANAHVSWPRLNPLRTVLPRKQIKQRHSRRRSCSMV